MKLSFLLEQARNGELLNISNKKFTDRVIISYANLAMIELYNRFELASEEAIVMLRADIPKTVYTLSSEDPDVSVREEPLKDHTFKTIVAAFNEDGTQISINDPSDPLSIYTVTYNQIQVPLIEGNNYISIIYSCNPEPIEYIEDENNNLVDQEIKLPTQLLEAALHYIGYRASLAIDSNSQNSNIYYNQFLASCNRADALGLVASSNLPTINVTERGYL